MAPKKNKTTRVSVDIKEIIAEIDAYPQAAGFDPDLWAEMSYPQKCLYLAKKELKAVRELDKDGE